MNPGPRTGSAAELLAILGPSEMLAAVTALVELVPGVFTARFVADKDRDNGCARGTKLAPF